MLFLVVSAKVIRSKVIVKGVSIIIGIGIVFPLSWESTVGAPEATFLREIRDLIPIHVFLILFQFVSNIYYHKRVNFSSLQVIAPQKHEVPQNLE